ncbi:MAG: single-stranded-DNA-specific exonuclease RecJ [Patescibacteria group bacterium]
MVKKWLVAKKIPASARDAFPELDPAIVQLLYNRGLRTQGAVDEFIACDYTNDLHDSFLFRDMQKAIGRIFAAVERGERITVHGDYDADGVSATVLLVSVLKELGAEVGVYIPHRQSEGYGLNEHTVEELHGHNTGLIVTVDCGIANKKEIALAVSKGIDVIVTDHHEEPPELPGAYAIINPHVKGERYPFRELSGVGVAFKLVQALIKRDGGKKIKEGFEKWLLDLVALGTIGDLVPLIGENRTLVKYGIVVLRKTKRVGLQELAQSIGITLETFDTSRIGYSIVPRLNAAGRMDHANTAYELLMTNDRQHARQVSEDLEKTNQERQRITEKMVNDAKKQIGEVNDQKILFAIGEGWQVGVVGLVAGRLTDRYARPAVVMGSDNGEAVGSGRSVPGFDITKALVESRDLLERFGGHATACGFTLKRESVELFKKRMYSIAERELTAEELTKHILIDCEASLEQLGWNVAEALEAFEPYGTGNERPRFVSYGLEVTDVQKVGKDGKHLRLTVQQGGTVRKMIAFGFGDSIGEFLSPGDRVDAVYELSFNEWNGNRELQLKLIDIRVGEVK